VTVDTADESSAADSEETSDDAGDKKEES